MTGRVLLLSGTREARLLARALAARPGITAIASLAGLTAEPADLGLPTRRGGFGGPAGLAAWCRAEAITHIVDATHPWARRIQSAAARVAAASAIAHIRLERPAWPVRPGWHEVGTVDEAIGALPAHASALFTTGTRDLAALTERPDVRAVVRSITAIDGLPAHAQWLCARPPFTLDDERAVMRRHAVTHLVTRNAGGSGTEKLDAAAAEGVRTLMIRRPAPSVAASVPDVGSVLDWLDVALA